MRRIALWLAWIVPFAIYAASLDGAVEYWDTGEMQVVPWILGIAHSTGFPVFTMLGWVFSHAFALGPVSWRIALFSALAMSLAAWLVACTVDLLEGSPWVGAASSWMFAFGSVAWTRGTRAEVHALATAFGMFTLYLFARWYRTGDRRILPFAALAFGLGIATHPIVALLLPALLVLLLVRIRSTGAPVLAVSALLCIAGIACYAYLPIRSAIVTRERLDPTRSLGLPPGKPFWNNDHPATLKGFVTLVSGSEFNAGGTFARLLSPQMYVREGPKFVRAWLTEFIVAGNAVAVLGAIVLLRRDPWLGVSLIAAASVTAAFALGYSIEADPQRYYLMSYGVTAVFVGCGVNWLQRKARNRPFPGAVSIALAAAVLLVVNRGTFSQRTSPGAQSVIDTVVRKTPDDAILIAPWLYATPLAYGAYVERGLGGRIVETAWLADDAQRVPGWLRRRPVYVVGQVFGSVDGYHLQLIPGNPPLYRVVKN